MPYDALVITAHPDDAEVQMGGTIAKLTDQGKRVLIVDLCDGEPTEYAEPGVRVQQAQRAAQILGADRTYDRKQRALAEYRSIFAVDAGDQLLDLYEAEDLYMGRLFGVAYAEIFKAHSPLLVDDLTLFKPGLHA